VSATEWLGKQPFLTHGEVRRLAQECAPPHDTLIYFLAYTGLRFGRWRPCKFGI
jgi:hypothetical protein